MTKLSQTEELAIRIRRRMQDEQLQAGSFFMTEAQVAEEYGVSRKVAREAIGKLQALGFVTSRKRKGIVIGKPDPLRLLADSLPSLASSADDFVELMNLRYALELGAIELAVRRATDEQIARLAVVESEMEQVLREAKEIQRVIELDIRFHSLILEMTGSKMIAGMQRILVDFFTAVQPPTTFETEAVERVIWEHRTLYLAIRDRDVDGARAMLRLQLRPLLEAGLHTKLESTPEASAEKG